MQALYFTPPYISGAALLFIHKDNQAYTTPADLAGKRIGVCAGCAYESYLQGTLVIPGQPIDFKIQNAVVVGYDTDTSALADLALGDGARLDAVLTDPATGDLAIQEGLPIKQLGEPVYRDFSAVAIDKKSSADPVPLVIRITGLIQQMHQEGFLKALSIRYYQDDFASPASQYDSHALGQFQPP